MQTGNPDEYWGFVDEVDRYRGESQVRLDCILRKEFDLITAVPAPTPDQFADIQPVTFLFETKKKLQASSWLKVRDHGEHGLTEGNVTRAERFDDTSQSGLPTALSFSRAAPSESQLLRIHLALERLHAGTPEDFLAHIGDLDAAEFVAVYNVGQGNCNAVCNAEGRPLLYVDFGGGCFANAHTYKTPLDFCFSESPGVILSHWDSDHWWSMKSSPDVLESPCLAPVQTVGPSHVKQAAKLAQKGNLYLWPSSDTATKKSVALEAFRGTGKINDKNNSGIIVVIHIRNGSVLLPGDASYRHISRAFSGLTGLVASHHGAFRKGDRPPATVDGVAGISCGKDNTYKHPRDETKTKLRRAGWERLYNTRNGHLSIGFHAGCGPCTAYSCGSCSLAIKQFG